MNWFQGKGTNFIRATGSGIQFRLQTRVSILSLKAKHIQRKGRIFLRALILWRRTRKQNYLSFSKGQKQLRCSSSNCVIRTVFVLLLLLAFLRSGTPEAHLKGEKENSNCWWMLHKIFDMVHISLCLYYGLLLRFKTLLSLTWQPAKCLLLVWTSGPLWRTVKGRVEFYPYSRNSFWTVQMTRGLSTQGYFSSTRTGNEMSENLAFHTPVVSAVVPKTGSSIWPYKGKSRTQHQHPLLPAPI